ncbi:syntaxin-like isoform X2 [Ischnura elegans]|uniref:syntaxin-like isoform X2 n=1 Tax=Ischnura elegans TaxID=197161 RepID=UPI001ED87A18|nr:syntaxin-like isoform X2 [Ischnura elegans]
MRDRLTELKEKSAANQSNEEQDVTEDDISPRRGSIVVYMDRRNTLTALEDSFMHDFHNEVEDVQEKINSIEKHNDEIRKLHRKMFSMPRTDSTIQVELDDRMASVKSLSKEIRSFLLKSNRTIEEQEVTQRYGTKTSNTSDMWTDAEFRIRRTQQAMLSRQFSEALHDFANIRVEIREKHKQWLRTQMKIVSQDPTDEELEDIIDSGKTSVFTGNVLMETMEARRVLDEVKARHEEIIKIEQSIRELRDLFVDMAILVEAQGGTIDVILYHVGKTAEHAEKAKRKIHQAKELKTSVRKKKIIIAILLIIVVIIVGLIIYFTVAPVKAAKSF